jgi:hypothetical protein
MSQHRDKPQNLVIPNRAESPARNLLFVDATKNAGHPIACPERSRRVSLLLRDIGFHELVPLGIWKRHDREGHDPSRAATQIKRTRHSEDCASTPRPRSPKNLCHSESGWKPGEEPAVCRAPRAAGAPSFAHFCERACPIKKIGGSQLLNRSISFQRDADTSSEETS